MRHRSAMLALLLVASGGATACDSARSRQDPLAPDVAASVSGAAAPPAAANVVSGFQFVVQTVRDSKDANPGDGLCQDSAGECSLRAAIEESNAAPPYPPSAPERTIWLAAATYQLTLGTLEIANTVDILGAGQFKTLIDGNFRSTVFLVRPTNLPGVNIAYVTIQNGKAPTFEQGGGIYVAPGARLGLFSSRVQNNATTTAGGGIANGGSLRIFGGTVEGNRVPLDGGGGLQSSGGGIMNFSGADLDIGESIISGNEATRGGGIRNAGGRLQITNSTISGNKASARGGGLMNFGFTVIAFATITNNQANATRRSQSEPAVGGGIYHEGTTFQGKDVFVQVGNSILANNTDNRSRGAYQFSPDCFTAPGAQITSFTGNVIGIWSTDTCVIRDFMGRSPLADRFGDPQLDSLAFNGGPTRPGLRPGETQTHRLLPGSPAIDWASVWKSGPFACPEFDQRFVLRPYRVGTTCDAGAFER